MPKYRKKPVVVTAEQFLPNKTPWPAGVEKSDPEGIPIIKTLEGDMIVSNGDYVITGIKGERYPCKPDIFEATYELVREE
jgi:hypothetical protein